MMGDAPPPPRASWLWRYPLLLLGVVLFVGPFVWMALTALQDGGGAMRLSLRPSDWTLTNFSEIWTNYALGGAFVNSVLVAVATVLLNVLFCSLAAYPLARMDFPGSRVVFLLILSTLMIPIQVYMIPLYDLVVALRLDGNLLSVVLPYAATALGIYLLKQYYATIPRDLDEAARIDGAGEVRLWWSIMVPLTKPAIAAMAIFIFVQNWSNFLWPLIALGDRNPTLPLALYRLEGVFEANTRYIYAGSVIAVLPIVVFFLAAQRFFLGGLSAGSVKG